MNDLWKHKETINISVFGPADHGKSTLVGYLFSQYRKEDFNKYIQKVQKKLVQDYQKDRMYAYVSDRHTQEQVGFIDQDETGRQFKGTTQHVHGLAIPIIEDTLFHFIDNPGHHRWQKETIMGISRGDYGIFVMAIKELHEKLDLFKSLLKEDKLISFPEEIRQYIVPLYIALKLGLKLCCVVFSKMDAIKYNESIYKECEKVIKEFLTKHFDVPEDKTVIVPTSIIATTEVSENVINKTDKIPWYSDSPLIKKIVSLYELPREENYPFFLPVQKSYFKIPGHN